MCSYGSDCDYLCSVSFILQDCVFEYKRAHAIQQRTIISDALIDVVKAGMRKGSDWVVKVLMRDTTDNEATTVEYASRRTTRALKRIKK